MWHTGRSKWDHWCWITPKCGSSENKGWMLSCPTGAPAQLNLLERKHAAMTDEESKVMEANPKWLSFCKIDESLEIFCIKNNNRQKKFIPNPQGQENKWVSDSEYRPCRQNFFVTTTERDPLHLHIRQRGEPHKNSVDKDRVCPLLGCHDNGEPLAWLKSPSKVNETQLECTGSAATPTSTPPANWTHPDVFFSTHWNDDIIGG